MSNSIFTEYMNDVERYLKSTLIKGVPEHTLQDISAYSANRATVLVCDALHDRDREWKRSLQRGHERSEEESAG